MPSIAILKSEGDHNSYGDISIVFRPNAVDPEANADNKIYSADAYTPRFPQTEYSLNRKAMAELADKLNTSPSMLEVNEIAAVIVPSEISSEVKNKLDKLGIKVVTYDKSKELSRKDAVNSIEGIRFSLKDNYFYRLTEGQIKKLLANNTKFKVYSKTDAESIVNNVIGSYMAFGDKYGDLRGKSKKEVVEILWRGLNTADTGKQGVVALDVAEYIIQHSAMENLWDDGDNQAYIDTIAVLKPYLHNLIVVSKDRHYLDTSGGMC